MARVKLKDMAEKYDRKVPEFSKRWGEITPKKKSAWEEGVAFVLDVSPAEVKRGDIWAREVTAAVPIFESRVKGKGPKLAENYKIAMTTA